MACLQSLEDGILQTILGNNLFDNCSNQQSKGLRSFGGIRGGGVGNPSDRQTGPHYSHYNQYRNGTFECSGTDQRGDYEKWTHNPCSSNSPAF
jgi:hypothetical protein